MEYFGRHQIRGLAWVSPRPTLGTFTARTALPFRAMFPDDVKSASTKGSSRAIFRFQFHPVSAMHSQQQLVCGGRSISQRHHHCRNNSVRHPRSAAIFSAHGRDQPESHAGRSSALAKPKHIHGRLPGLQPSDRVSDSAQTVCGSSQGVVVTSFADGNGSPHYGLQ